MMKVQRVWEKAGRPMHNISLAPILLADPCYPYYRKEYKNYRGHQFWEEIQLLTEATSLLNECDDSLFKQELKLTIDLLLHGCHLGKRQLSTPNLIIKEIEERHIEKLIEELKPLIDQYKELWLNRSRPGGLTDSVGRFETLLEWYQNALD